MTIRTLGKIVIGAAMLATVAFPVMAEESHDNSGSATSTRMEQLKAERQALQDKIKAEQERVKAERAAKASAAKAEREAKAAAAKAEREAKLQAARACVAVAVDKRETSIDVAFDAYTVAMKAALSTRKTSLAAGWALTDSAARKTAIDAAWKAWRSSSLKARQDMNAAKRTGWNTFTTDRKACGDSARSLSNENASVDASL